MLWVCGLAESGALHSCLQRNKSEPESNLMGGDADFRIDEIRKGSQICSLTAQSMFEFVDHINIARLTAEAP